MVIVKRHCVRQDSLIAVHTERTVAQIGKGRQEKNTQSLDGLGRDCTRPVVPLTTKNRQLMLSSTMAKLRLAMDALESWRSERTQQNEDESLAF